MRGSITKIVKSNGELCYKGTVLYCTVLYCTVLFCTVLYCAVLYCTVLYCIVLYCTQSFLLLLPSRDALHRLLTFLFSTSLLMTITGRHVFMGYMYMPDQSAETIDEDGIYPLLPLSLSFSPSSFSSLSLSQSNSIPTSVLSFFSLPFFTFLSCAII